MVVGKFTNCFVQPIWDVELFPSFIEVWTVDDDVFNGVVFIACWT